MAERVSSTPLTTAFRERATAELSVLNSKLHDRLKQDIAKIYSECLFSDLELLFKSGRIRTHKSLLETRAPSFYRELCHHQSAIYRGPQLSERINVDLIESFIREVYNRNVLRHKEDAVVAQIKCAARELEPATPDSEVFVTPIEGSPLDPPPASQFCKQHAPYLSARSAQNLYYSLVHVEDELSPHSASQFSFDKELAEQDLLSDSFRSILLKEENLRTNKPLTLDFRSLEGEVVKVKKRPLKVLNKQETYVIGNVDMNSRSKCEDEMSMGESLMEAVSSGYATGGSPRGDTTEVATTSDDIPHDRSAASSSVSSDGGTWDDQQTFVEKEPPLLMADSEGKEIASVLSPPELVNKHTDGISSVTAIETVKEKPEHCLEQPHTPTTAKQGNFFIDASTLRDENELYTSTLTTTIHTDIKTSTISTTDENTMVFNSYSEPLTTGKVIKLQTTGEEKFAEELVQQEIETNLSEMEIVDEGNLIKNKSDLDLSNNIVDKNSTNEAKLIEQVLDVNKDLVVEGTTTIPQLEQDVAIPENEIKPTLTRRNTFELELNEEQKARLKEEYERSNGFSDISGTDFDITTIENEKNKAYNIVQTDKIITNTRLIVNKAEVGDDAHSPDSLNNDFPYESYSVMAKEEEIISEMNMIVDSSYGKGHANDLLRQSALPPSDNTKDSASPSKALTLNDSHQQQPLNSSAVSDLSNSSGPNSSLSASCLSSSRREAESTDETTASPRGASDKHSDPCTTTAAVFTDSRIESRPILSGMSDLSDYSLSASPVMSRRRPESDAPILSGGFEGAPPRPPQHTRKPKLKATSSMNTSWVVDMSDSGKSPPLDLQAQERYTKSSTSGMGFFVPLDDPYPSIDSVTSNSSERSERKYTVSERNSSSSCGFYIDLKNDFESNGSDCESIGQHRPNAKDINSAQLQEKKLFPLFIDIGVSNGKDSPRSKPGSPFLPNKRKGPSLVDRMSVKQLDKKSTSTSSDSGLDCAEQNDVIKSKIFDSSLDQGVSDCSTNDSACSTKRQSFFMFIEANESPVTRRRTLPSGMRHSANRHSWNNEKKFTLDQHAPAIKEHKRSSSISYDETVNKLELEKSGPASIDEVGLKREKKKMQSSWHGQVKASSELSRIIANGAKHEYDRAKEQRKSLENADESVEKIEELSCSIKSDETYDVSNATSSKDDRTFVVDDVSKAVNISSNDLELSTPSHDVISDLSKDDTETDPAAPEPKSTSSNATNKSAGSNDNDLTPKLCEHSTSQPVLAVEREPPVSFVKLSDMDKEPAKKTTWTVGAEGKSSRMSRSIPEGSWLESKMLANSASSRSLSRLFPHLYPQKAQDSDPDQSPQSSMQSSVIDPSPMEMSTEGSVSSGGGGGNGGAPCSRLGEDLLRMFLDEISPDVTVDVGGRRIKAHKCILSSRCQYFAGMLSGGWVESAGNVISLQGFSYNAVHFALCHIYSGASNIPDTINIVELATLADMLCLEGLKEVIMYTLKVKYCHFFHKPCSGCTVGVLECLPLAAAYGLDEIYRKSLRWITRHFVRVWPTKEFAALPKELQDKCYRQHVVNMAADNVLHTILGCESLEATVPNVRRAQSVLALSTKLHEVAVKYLTQHFAAVITSDAFMTIGKEDAWTVTRLEETLLSASRNLSPDQACQSYRKLKAVIANISATCQETCEMAWKVEFIDLLGQLETTVEDCLVRQAGRAARTTSWSQMDLALRRRIQEIACLVFAPGPRTTITSSSTTPRARSIPTSQASKRSTVNTSSTSAAISSSAQPSRPQSASNQLCSSLPKPKVNAKLAQVKSRYMDPRPVRREAAESQFPTSVSAAAKSTSSLPRRPSSGKTVSSSDSSRTSSPATNSRVIRPRPTTAGGSTKSSTVGRDVGTRSGSERATSSLPGRGEPRVKSSESVAEDGHRVARPRATTRLDGTKSSPTLPSKRQSHGGSPSLGKSPATNSSASPSLRHRAPPPSAVTPAESGTAISTSGAKQQSTLKRTTTFRVASKTTKASAAKQAAPREYSNRSTAAARSLSSQQQSTTTVRTRPTLNPVRSSTFSKEDSSLPPPDRQKN
ncbi:uncharacterized protein isoform X4 [Rhodnius prolixus]|uniref:uncharacterized protein isoform X4 n=1 Tax=Rhodnius prolixus TaxID=13249 RepID=UPI003D18DD5A